MKKLKQIITQLQSISTDALGKPDDLLWKYLFYSPKMPLRLGQEQLLQSAEKISLKVNDEYFGQEELTFHTLLLNGEREHINYCLPMDGDQKPPILVNLLQLSFIR